MHLKKTLESRIRGWLPKEPLNPNKSIQIRLESHPVKLRQRLGKVTINTVQFIVVVLAVTLILGGLYLNSISTRPQTTYNLPWTSTTYHEPFQLNGNNYNCSINLVVSPPFDSDPLGGQHLIPLSVYLNEPNNITSGSYCVTLRYLRYNTTSSSYDLQGVNENGTFSNSQKTAQVFLFNEYALSPPFEPGPASQQPINKDMIFSFYTNSTGKLPVSLFTITAPIQLNNSSFIVNYPYLTIGSPLLAFGIICLVTILVISFVSLGKKRQADEKTSNLSK